MGVTPFPHGVSSFGVPLMGGGAFTLPRMGGNVAGSGPAKVFFVDPANGSDGNVGTDPDNAFATVSYAYSQTVDKRGDVIYLLNDGNTSGTSRENSTITWAKDNTHLIGLCAPTVLSQRARISPATTHTNIVTPQLLVSGNGNIFANLSFFEGGTQDSTASTCIKVTGSRNYFNNVAMMNMGDATNGNTGDEAGSNHLYINGGSENTFDGCYIGLDTAARSAANANVKLDAAATRNVFRDCIFPMFADASTPLFVDIPDVAGIDRWVLFQRCFFINVIGSTATSLAGCINVNASAGGLVLLNGCSQVSGGEWAAATNANIYIDMPVPDAVGGASGGEAGSFST